MGVKVGPSPEWLQRRLIAIGQVPRNNVVDATNFVLFELGQPTHVFDLATLAIDLHRLVSRPKVDSEAVFKERAFGHEQGIFRFDYAADVVRQSAVRKRRIRSALKHDNLGILVHAAQTCRARSAAGHAAHDHDCLSIHGVTLCSRFYRRIDSTASSR